MSETELIKRAMNNKGRSITPPASSKKKTERNAQSLDRIPSATTRNRFTSPGSPLDGEDIEQYLAEREKLKKRLLEVEMIISGSNRDSILNDRKVSFDDSCNSESESATTTNPNSSISSSASSSHTGTQRRHTHLLSKEELHHSFKVDGLTSEEVIEELEKSKSHHARSIDEAEEKIVTFVRDQVLLEDAHEETFYELFYDLILAVVFIKLSYLKYDLTMYGVLSVGALFANFWSCWSLLNTYVTMLHTEDVLHRLYYVAHITASFLMAISIENPEFQFFNYRYMAWYHAGASVICRLVTLFMWGYAFKHDFVKVRHHESISDYTNKDVGIQISFHFLTLLASICLFVITMVIPWSYSHSDGHHWPIAVIWLLAITIENVGNSYGAVYMQLPFSALYAGSRMQSWLMLCFGESVIALLIEPIFYDSAQVGSICAAFIMILCLCTAYFDIVDADEFLHLLVIRNEKFKAILFMNFQCFFSFSVFLVGVSLKTIIYVSNTVYYYETTTGCGVSHHHEAAHRKLSSFLTDKPSTRDGDLFDIWNQFNLNTNHIYQNGGGGLLHHLYSTMRQTISKQENNLLGDNSWMPSTDVHRQLSGATETVWTINALDRLLFKSFVLLSISATSVMIFSIFVGYCMPIGLPDTQVRIARLGAVAVSMTTMVIPFSLKSLATPCFLRYEGYYDDDAPHQHENETEGISSMKGLVIISMIILVSFFVALWSLDPNREATYAKLEEEAHYNKTKSHLTHLSLSRKASSETISTIDNSFDTAPTCSSTKSLSSMGTKLDGTVIREEDDEDEETDVDQYHKSKAKAKTKGDKSIAAGVVGSSNNKKMSHPSPKASAGGAHLLDSENIVHPSAESPLGNPIGGNEKQNLEPDPIAL